MDVLSWSPGSSSSNFSMMVRAGWMGTEVKSAFTSYEIITLSGPNWMYSVVGTLHHRAKTVFSSPDMLKREGECLSRVLTRCKYPTWAINRVRMKMKKPAQKKKHTSNNNNQANYQKPYMVVPYYKGLSESVKRTCNKHGVQVYFRGGVTIKNLLMAPKDQDPMLKKSGVIYRYKCEKSRVWWGVYRRVLQNFWRKVQRTSEDPIPHLWPL